MEAVTDFIFLGSKITADGDWSYGIKRSFLLERKAMVNLNSILKGRDITGPNKGPYSQSYGFSSSHIWMWELDYKDGRVLENWCFQRSIFEGKICWRRLLRVPWTTRRSNQSILKEINPEYSLEGLMLKLKFQYFGHLMRCRLIRKDPDVGKDWRQEEKWVAEDEMVR